MFKKIANLFFFIYYLQFNANLIFFNLLANYLSEPYTLCLNYNNYIVLNIEYIS